MGWKLDGLAVCVLQKEDRGVQIKGKPPDWVDGSAPSGGCVSYHSISN